ncbi:uncharacterized protein LOC144436671 [Glandiceps talaboti]
MCAARFAPFGTDIQPKTKVKIVGGRQVLVNANTPPQSSDSESTAPTPISRQDSPNILTQPNFKHYDTFGSHSGYNTPTQHDRTRKIPSQSADADKFNSQVHGSHNRNGFPGGPSVLPPIKSQIKSNPLSWPDDDVDDHQPNTNRGQGEVYHKPEPRRRSPPPSPEPLPHLGKSNYSMTNQLKDLLLGYDSYSFQDMYTDATEFDTRLTGFINQPQMNMLCLRHRLPIDSSMLRILFSSFAKEDNPDLVDYEKLIKYLARAQLGSTDKANTLLDDVVNRFMETKDDPVDKGSTLEKHIAMTMNRLDYEEPKQNKENQTKPDISPRKQKPPEYHRPQEHHQPRKKRSAQGDGADDEQEKPVVRKQPIKVFSDREDAKLLMLIEQQCMQGKEEKMDIDAMTRTFTEMDRSRYGTVSQKQIKEACFKHRVPVQGSIMEKLLQRCDLGDGQYSWVNFVEFLERVQPINMTLELSPRSKAVAADPERPGTWPKKERKPREPRRNPLIPGTPPEPAAPPWETRKPLARLGRKNRSPSPELELQHIRETPSPTKTDNDPIPVQQQQYNISDGSYQASQLKALAKQQEDKRIKDMQKKAAKDAASEKDQTWFQRFMHLAQGLYNADSTNSGYLERREIGRLINNYNLIYQLNIDTSHIDKAVATCSRSDGQVAIEPLLETLRLKSN